MTRNHNYHVYIVASRTRVLYIGVTSDLEARLYQHRTATDSSFAARYRTHRLVYVETYSWIQDAIAREKQLKGWRRDRKIAQIESMNPNWDDLSVGW